MRKFIKSVDRISEKLGRAGSYLVLALVAGITYDVSMRYLFKAPTIWAYDVTWMLFGSLSALGFAYCQLADRHIRMDLFYGRLSARGKAIVDIVCYIVIFFPLAYALVRYCGEHAISSALGGERSSASTWRPPIYPFKILAAFGLLLWAVQGIAIFIKKVHLVVKRRPFDEP